MRNAGLALLMLATAGCQASPDGADGDDETDDIAADLGDFESDETTDGPLDSEDGGDDLAEDAPAETGDEETEAETEDAAGPCPPGMAFVADTFCIDRYEGALEEQDPGGAWSPASPYLTVGSRVVRAVPAEGIEPQGYISGSEAASACAASGKRLCTSEEWLEACRGPEETIFPYGDEHVDAACNDAYAGTHPVVDFFGTSEGVWDTAHMNDPGINQQDGTVAEGGSFAGCVSGWGVFDMHGNLHEWVSDAEGTFRGGFYSDASINGPGCTYVTTAHSSGYHDYSTGFRCCADP